MPETYIIGKSEADTHYYKIEKTEVVCYAYDVRIGSENVDVFMSNNDNFYLMSRKKSAHISFERCEFLQIGKPKAFSLWCSNEANIESIEDRSFSSLAKNFEESMKSIFEKSFTNFDRVSAVNEFQRILIGNVR